MRVGENIGSYRIHDTVAKQFWMRFVSSSCRRHSSLMFGTSFGFLFILPYENTGKVVLSYVTAACRTGCFDLNGNFL